LFILFVIALELNELDHINPAEMVFIIYALGFTLEKVAAMQEHGIRGDFIIIICVCMLSSDTEPKYFSKALGSVMIFSFAT
jgi:hypothetical protein